MMRLSPLIKCKALLESSSFSVSQISQSVNKLLQTGVPVLSSVNNYNTWSWSCSFSCNVNEKDKWSPFHQQVRHGHKYYVKDLSVKWLRRRRKAMEQRLKVLNPSSPVIEHITPLPLTNEGRYPPDLFQVEEVRDLVKEEDDKKGIVAEINRQVQTKEQGRLFAVIHLKGKQFKVTPEDIIILHGYWYPNIGDRLRLHKVLLLGGSDFTLVGRPMVDPSMVRVEGTVIEKTLSYTKLHFILKKRKNFRRLKLCKDPYTMLRINMVEMARPLAQTVQVVQ